MKRRKFVKNMSLGSTATLLSNTLWSMNLKSPVSEPLRFGICADVHKDVIHDADSRLKAFIEDASTNKLDFIIQLGDFCRPYDYNQSFMELWNAYQGKKYHVLGNHDTDGGFSREEVIDYWKAIGNYYSFDCKGYHFIVLDGNDIDPSPDKPGGYARFIGIEQLNWLANDLEKTNLPTIVFCHQGLDNDLGGISNATQSRLVLERANEIAGFQKVKLVFSGHHHQDYLNQINNIHYVQINSMSYQWLGEKHLHQRYDEEINKSHPWIKYTVPYKDPLWAYAEINTLGTFKLQGKKSSFVGPTPKELEVSEYDYGYPIVPWISNRELQF